MADGERDSERPRGFELFLEPLEGETVAELRLLFQHDTGLSTVLDDLAMFRTASPEAFQGVLRGLITLFQLQWAVHTGAVKINASHARVVNEIGTSVLTALHDLERHIRADDTLRKTVEDFIVAARDIATRCRGIQASAFADASLAIAAHGAAATVEHVRTVRDVLAERDRSRADKERPGPR